MNNYLEAREGMEKLLDLTADAIEGFNRREYTESFKSLYVRMVPTFDAIEELYVSVNEPDTMISNMAQALTANARGRLQSERVRRKKDMIQMNLNMQMVAFVLPGILDYKGQSSRPLADEIIRQWKEAFPKSNISAATFEEIEKGFHHKWCYVTTAVCRSLKKGDDCYELNLLRSYRDRYMRSQPDGEEIVREYYDIAPSIVKHINQRDNADTIYRQIYDGYIRPCIHMIENGKDRECIELYTQMVKTLQEKYFYS